MQKIVLITGASSKLGSVIITSLLEKDYIVYAGGRKIRKSNSTSKIQYVKLDITLDFDVKKVITQIIKEQKRIDILINCAGNTLVGPTTDFSTQDYIDLLNVNTVGAFRLMKEVIPFMKKQKSGTIISITSMSGIISFPNFGIYSSSKFALEALSEALYYELKKEGISITTIAPGAIYNPEMTTSTMPHKPAREKFFLLKLLFPMVTQEKIVQTIHQIINSRNPRSRVVLGRDAKVVHTMNRILPHRLWNTLMSYIWQKK